MAITENMQRKDVKDLIAAAVERFHSLMGVPVAMGAQITAVDEMRMVAGKGLRTDALRNLRIDVGTGVGGRVLATHRVMGVTDYIRSQSITHELDAYILEEGLRSLAAVPVIVNRKMRAVLFAGVHAAVRLSDRVLEELTQEARCLEQEIAIMEAFSSMRDDPKSLLSNIKKSSNNGPEWEQVRHAHSRLRLINSRVEEPEIKRELEVIEEMLITRARVAMDKPHLSARELDVLACVAMGRTNAEAAEEMGIGAETVKSYLRSCMRKLDAHNRYEAVSVARQMGILP